METARSHAQPAGRGPGATASEVAVHLHSSRRADGHSVVEAVMTGCAELHVAGGVLLQGTEGFGRSGRLRGDIHEGPVPLIAIVTSGDDASTDALWAQLPGGTLATRSPVAILDATAEPLLALGDEAAELVVHCRTGAGSADPAGIGGVLELLRGRGVAGATALAGLDGIVAGRRHRDRPFERSPAVPARVTAVDSARVLASAVPALLASPHVDFLTAKPIWVWKRRGRLGGTPIAADADGWRTLSVFTADDSPSRQLLHRRLLLRLRSAGAAGATVVRGRLGYAGDAAVRPRRGWRHGRAAPMLTTIVDTRDRVSGWFEIVDELTGDDGLVICECVYVHPASP